MKKHVIITGAAGNLGQVVTRKFLDLNYAVHAVISKQDNPEFMSAPDLSIYQANLMDEPEAKNAVNQICKKAGKLNLVIMIVGGFAMGNIEKTSLEDFEKMLRLNFVTAYNVVRPVLKKIMKQKDGVLFVFIGARPAIHPSQAKDMVAYALSKSLVFRLSEIINEEGKERNIRSAVIVPSIIDTPQNRKAMPDADFSKWVTAEEIAENIAHLVSQAGIILKDTVLKVYGDS